MTLRSLLRRVIPSIPETLDEEIGRLRAEAEEETLEQLSDIITTVSDDLLTEERSYKAANPRNLRRLTAILKALEPIYIQRAIEETTPFPVIEEPDRVQVINHDDPFKPVEGNQERRSFPNATPTHINLKSTRAHYKLAERKRFHRQYSVNRPKEHLPNEILSPERILHEQPGAQYGQIAWHETMRALVEETCFKTETITVSGQSIEMNRGRRSPLEIAAALGRPVKEILPLYVSVLYFDHQYSKVKIRKILSERVEDPLNLNITPQQITDMIYEEHLFDKEHLENPPRREIVLLETAQKPTCRERVDVLRKKLTGKAAAYVNRTKYLAKVEPHEHFPRTRRLARSPLFAAGLTIAIGSMLGYGLESTVSQREIPKSKYCAAISMPEPTLKSYPITTHNSHDTTLQFSPTDFAHILHKKNVYETRPQIDIQIQNDHTITFGIERLEGTNYSLSINHKLEEPVIVIDGYGEPIRIEPQMRRSGVTGAMDLADLLPEAVKEPSKHIVVKLYDGKMLVASTRGSGARIFGVSPALERTVVAYQEQRALHEKRDQPVTTTTLEVTPFMAIAEERDVEETSTFRPVETLRTPYYALGEASTRIDLTLRYMPSTDVKLDTDARKHMEKFLVKIYKQNKSKRFVPTKATVHELNDRELLSDLEEIVKVPEESGTTLRKIRRKLHMDETTLYGLLADLHPVGDHVFPKHEGMTNPNIYLNLVPVNGRIDTQKAMEMLGLMPDPDGNHCIARAQPNDAALFYILITNDLREIYEELREKLPRAETLSNSERRDLANKYDNLRQRVESWVSNQFVEREDPCCERVPIPSTMYQPNAALERRLQNSDYASALVQATLLYDRRRRGSAEGTMTIDEILNTVCETYNVNVSSRDLRYFVDSAEVERRSVRSSSEARKDRRKKVNEEHYAGKSTRQIAEESGWSESTIRRDYKHANA